MANVSSIRNYICDLLALEVARITRYCQEILQVEPLAHDDGVLLAKLGRGPEAVVARAGDLGARAFSEVAAAALLFDGNLNHELDIQGLLETLKPHLARSTRLIFVTYNSYLRGIYRLANALGFRHGPLPTTFLTHQDVEQVARLSGYELVRMRPVAYVPWRLLGLGSFVNKILPAVPVLRWSSLATITVLRPVKPETHRLSLSIVIPARNERGNIEAAVKRLACLGRQGIPYEVIFVEGHSHDGTWDEIERVRKGAAASPRIQACRQSGSGKADAVRLGFAKATGDLFTILDADLTMPPELLGRFYEAYASGQADFVNGSRLVYPMEDDSMRFINKIGNIFFAKALSYVLDTALSDSLCGTKLISRRDYLRFRRWREDFGDFDPFGDFEFLFPAAALGLGVITIPIRYRSRTYGSTNIRRFRHGLLLLKMTAIGLLRLKLGTVRGIDGPGALASAAEAAALGGLRP